ESTTRFGTADDQNFLQPVGRSQRRFVPRQLVTTGAHQSASSSGENSGAGFSSDSCFTRFSPGSLVARRLVILVRQQSAFPLRVIVFNCLNNRIFFGRVKTPFGLRR